ncbi:MAG: sensor histidine kinase, partial [Deferrisomatales bacterium]
PGRPAPPSGLCPPGSCAFTMPMTPRPQALRPWLLLTLLAAATLAALGWLLQSTLAVRTEARARFFEQYNQQQLLLAELAARTIGELFETFHRNLGLVTSLFEDGEVTPARAADVQAILRKIYASLTGAPIIDLVVFDREGTVVAIEPPDVYTLGRNYEWRDYFRWARDEGGPGRVYLSPFMRLEGGQHRGDLALIVAQGMYAADGSFRGVATFTINFDELARKHILSVRIGEHGYAWLVDSHDQRVLVSPRQQIGGQRFDEAFLPRWPVLHELLVSTRAGRPGTGWYDYEDPVDPAKTVRKLVGYAPVAVEQRLWALGVATPEREVEALLASFLRRQQAVAATLVAAILAGAAALTALLVTWNRQLSRQVGVRTRDLAEARSQLEETFQELLSTKKLAVVGQMALGLTHEIRNPLSAIRMNLQLIRKRLPEPGLLAEHFAIAEEEILRLNRLLNDVLGFARPRPLRLEPTDLGALIEKVLALLDERFRAEGVRVEADLEAGAVAAADPEQLQQVVWNLVLNAAEAMESTPEPRVLSVGLRRRGPTVEIRVADTGPGVRPEDRERIFDPFYTTKAQGGGLGLSTLQSIVLRHGGSVALEDDGPGPGGAAFTVVLPRDGPPGADGSTP